LVGVGFAVQQLPVEMSARSMVVRVDYSASSNELSVRDSQLWRDPSFGAEPTSVIIGQGAVGRAAFSSLGSET
jgi:hypothetical protein